MPDGVAAPSPRSLQCKVEAASDGHVSLYLPQYVRGALGSSEHEALLACHLWASEGALLAAGTSAFLALIDWVFEQNFPNKFGQI